jgi:putative ABC transport system permease protein
MTDLTIIARSMRSRLFSTVTTALTVAVAVALLLVLLSMRDAGQRAFSRGGGNMHMLVSGDTDPLAAVLNGVFYARPPRRALSWAQYQEIAAAWPLEFAIPVAQGDSFRGFPTTATLTEFFERFEPVPGQKWRFREGHAFDGEFQAVLGAAAARGTGLGLGAQIVLTHGTPGSRSGEGSVHEHARFKFTVVGILEPTGTAHDRAVFVPLQSAWILHAHDRVEQEAHQAHAGGQTHADEHGGPEDAEKPTTVADLTDADRKITGIYIRVATREGSSTTPMVPVVFSALRAKPGITVAQPFDEIKRLFEVVGGVNQILVAMAGVVMVSSGIAIMLALYNSMEQRRRQIAVLRVLGASRARIFGLVVTESALLGILGAAGGIAAALVAARVVAMVMHRRLGLVIEPGLPFERVLVVAVAAVALAALAGVIPAVMAYRTGVARNLRPLG